MEVLLKKIDFEQVFEKGSDWSEKEKKHNIHSLTLRKSPKMVKMLLLSTSHGVKKFTYKIIILRRFGHSTGEWHFESEKQKK